MEFYNRLWVVFTLSLGMEIFPHITLTGVEYLKHLVSQPSSFEQMRPSEASPYLDRSRMTPETEKVIS